MNKKEIIEISRTLKEKDAELFNILKALLTKVAIGQEKKDDI
jgi:hypothetical protein